MKPINTDEISHIRKKRTALEVRVAQQIGECIKACCENTLREAIRLLLVEICQIPLVTLNGLLNKKSENFAMFVKKKVTASRAGLVQLCYEPNRLDPEVCSDTIRLFGELSEEADCQQLTGSKWSQHLAGKEKLKPEPTYLNPVDSYRKGWVPDSVPKPPRKEDLFGHRDRDKKTDITRSEAPYVPIPSQITRGVDKFEFGISSVIKTLDETFGIEPKGADVSGTTTDSIYALKYATQASGLDQHLGLLQLLPIATMVPAGHHSMIECAYPLSRWDYMDYSIGYYDTLMPQKCSGPDRIELARALNRFKVEADQMHVLVYRDDNGQEKGYLMERGDIDEFKKLARLRSAYGWCVAGGLRKPLLDNVLRIYSPRLLPA